MSGNKSFKLKMIKILVQCEYTCKFGNWKLYLLHVNTLFQVLKISIPLNAYISLKNSLIMHD